MCFKGAKVDRCQGISCAVRHPFVVVYVRVSGDIGSAGVVLHAKVSGFTTACYGICGTGGASDRI